MKNLKAFIAGSAFIFIAMICLQLAFVFIAVGYKELAIRFGFLNDISGLFRYLIGIPILLLVTSAGGFIAASIAKYSSKTHIFTLCSCIAIFTQGGMLFSTLEFAQITLTGLVVILLSILGAAAGGFYWHRKQSIQVPHAID